MTDFPSSPSVSPSDSPAVSPALPPLSPETIAQARAMYDDGAPNAEICEFLGLTEKQLLAFRRAQGWKLRDRFAVPPRRAPSWAKEDFEPPIESLTQEELMARMEAAMAREFLCAERDR